MSSMKRSLSETSPKYGGIPAKMPTPVRQKSPATPRPFTSPMGADPEPFYLFKDAPASSEVTGETNLICHYGLEHSYNKFSSKKVKEQLSAFLPHLPGMIDTVGSQDNSSLQALIDKPPIGGKELMPLSGAQLTGFKLHPGSIPDQYKLLHHQPPKKRKHKKHKKEHRVPDLAEPVGTEGHQTQEGPHDKKRQKKHKHNDGDENNKSKKRKEKKKKEKDRKKKSRQSPSHPSGAQPNEGSGPGRP